MKRTKIHYQKVSEWHTKITRIENVANGEEILKELKKAGALEYYNLGVYYIKTKRPDCLYLYPTPASAHPILMTVGDSYTGLGFDNLITQLKEAGERFTKIKNEVSKQYTITI